MKESVRAMVNYGFDELHLHRIRIKCDSLNIKSKAIPERLGFKLEGIIRESNKRGDVFSDELSYEFFKKEWLG
jgi:ribosomal-protein-serine acetyltransferase